jgi:hypothetical protein
MPGSREVLRLASDQNFNGDILRGLFRQRADLDVVRITDLGLRTASDPEILEWASAEGRILLTHDRNTIPYYAYARVQACQKMPGVFLVNDLMPIGQAVQELILAIECLDPEECRNLVRFFPL